MEKLPNRLRDFGIQWYATTEMKKLPDGNLENWKMGAKFAALGTAVFAGALAYWYFTTPAAARQADSSLAMIIAPLMLAILIVLLVIIRFKKVKYGKFVYGEGHKIPLEVFHVNHPLSQQGFQSSLTNLCEANGYSEPKDFIGTIVDGKPRVIFTAKNGEGVPEDMWTDGRNMFPVE